jgi:prepilin-type N-terminal cleavage/methylation domain-containing protein
MPRATILAVRRTRRAGMTLIELLIVMTIISIMASLSIGAVFKLRESQMKSFTETNLQKLASALDQQWKAAIDQFRDDLKNVNANPTQAALWNWCQTTANADQRRATVIYIKARLKAEFPVTIDTAKNPVKGLPGNINIAKPSYLQALSSVSSSAGNEEWESAALLYLALSQGRRGMAAFNPDDIDPSAIQTRPTPPQPPLPNNQQFKIFVDAWGQPLRYYIFPYSNDELNGPPYFTPPQGNLNDKRGKDPQDPEATLDGFQSPAFQAIHPLLLKAGVRHLIPVVASAGRDGQWGIDQNWMQILPGGQDQANDNIYSYRLRQVGARGD